MVPAMSYDIDTIDGLVEALGGPSDLGAALGLSPSAVCNWSLRNFIPPSWHFRLLYELKIRGLTAHPSVFEATEEQFAVLFPPQSRKRGNVCAVA